LHVSLCRHDRCHSTPIQSVPAHKQWLSSAYPSSSDQSQAVAIGHLAAIRVIVKEGHDASGATGDRSPRF
jgi:hypothetical protein